MAKRSGSDLRRSSGWLALVLSAAILACTVSVTLLWPGESPSLAAGLHRHGIGALLGYYHGPHQCAECHTAEFHAWSGTTHARATFDPVFQLYLQQAEQPGECFTCHTTGYNATTGEFLTAGVTCEACHGPYRADHPGQSMRLATTPELCGACHRSTLAEWQTSPHGQAGIACVACHEVHTLQTRAAVATGVLCAGCHRQRTQSPLHQKHKAAGLSCGTCHVARPSGSAASAISGHATTGHQFVVVASTCDRCHTQ